MGFDESKHPRDEDGKFATKGAPHKGENVDKTGRRVYNNNRGGNIFVFNDPDSKEIYDNISAGRLYEVEDLVKLPTVQKMEEQIEAFDKKYGVTANISTPKREVQRKEWVQNFLTGKEVQTLPPSGGALKREHKATIVVGLPASGKSTKIVEPLSDEQGAFIMDSDEMKKLIPEFAHTNGGAANATHKESKDLMQRAFNEFTSGSMKGTNVIIPIIGDKASKIYDQYMKDLFGAGYDIEIAYKAATAKESANRVIKRAISTGRLIPTGVVQGYDDGAVCRAFEEILATDYNGKRVKRSKRSEI